jgi:hypothetical protein
MADLLVTIQESITLPNRNKEVLSNTKTITGVNQTLRRIDTIPALFSGDGIEIIRFVDTEQEQTGGAFVKSSVKYIRITNLDKFQYGLIYLIDTNEESVIFKLDPGKSLMFGSADFNATSVNDYVIEGVWDEDYYSSFVYFNSIKAKGFNSTIQLEYFVASS